MPSWLDQAKPERLDAKLSAFAQTASGPADLSEVSTAAAALLQVLFDANRVSIWGLSGDGSSLRWCAGTTTEWSGTEVKLSHYPQLAGLLAKRRTQWVELALEAWPDTPAPLLGAHSFVFLPLCFQGETCGCAWVVCDEPKNAPAEVSREVGQVVATLLAGAWQIRSLHSQGQKREEKWAQLWGRAQSLLRAPTDQRSLEALLQAMQDLVAAHTLAVYEQQGERWQRLVAVGQPIHFPAELPAGTSASWPWEQAVASSATILFSPGESDMPLPPDWNHYSSHSTDQPCEMLVLALPGSTPTPRVLMAALPRVAPRSLGGLFEVWAAFLGWMLAARQISQTTSCAEARYQQLWESLPIPSFRLDAQGCFVFVNRFLLEWTGEARAQLLGQSLQEVLAGSAAEALAGWLAEGKSAWRHELSWPTHAGAKSCLLALERIEPPGDAMSFFGFLLDLSTIQQIEQAQDTAASSLRAILESIQEGVCLVGADRTVQLTNHRLAHLLGMDLREIGAQKAHSAFIEQVKARFREPDRVAARWHYLNTRMEEISWDELELAQPQQRYLERFVRPVYDSTQRLLGRLEIYREVTAQRQLEQKMLQREQLAALGQLVSGVAHELSNPLTAVSGYAQLLQRHKMPAAARSEMSRLVLEAERACRIAKNLLLFARPARAERQRVSVEEALERALQFRAYELTVENISVERRYAATLPPVWANPHQLQQVFLNIILNAEHAIRDSRDRGTITLRTLRLPDPDRVRIEISDDGSGVLPEDLPHVFEPFFSTKGANEGTGLGLSVSHAIIKEHQGQIYAENRPGGGATFAVELPVAQVAEGADTRTSLGRSVVATKGRVQILIVDDEQSVAQLIADVLRQQGYGVHIYTNSRQALEEAVTQEFDLAICDIKMPEVDGETFHRQLAERGHALAQRILFTTGDTLARQTNEFLRRVGLPCLSKPFLVDELKAAVRDLLAAPDREHVDSRLG